MPTEKLHISHWCGFDTGESMRPHVTWLPRAGAKTSWDLAVRMNHILIPYFCGNIRHSDGVFIDRVKFNLPFSEICGTLIFFLHHVNFQQTLPTYHTECYKGIFRVTALRNYANRFTARYSKMLLTKILGFCQQRSWENILAKPYLLTILFLND